MSSPCILPVRPIHIIVRNIHLPGLSLCVPLCIMQVCIQLDDLLVGL